MLTTMSATIIQFPDRAAAVSAAAGRSAEARRRQDAVRAGFSTELLPVQTEEGWLCQAQHVLDHVEDLLDDGDAGEVVALCEQATSYLLGAAPDIDDGSAVMALIDRLRDIHMRACHAAPPDPVALADFVYALARSDSMGVLHGVIDPYVPVLGPTGLAAIRRHLAEDQRRQRRLSDIARKIDEFRLRPILESLSRAQHPSAV